MVVRADGGCGAWWLLVCNSYKREAQRRHGIREEAHERQAGHKGAARRQGDGQVQAEPLQGDVRGGL